MTRRTPVGKWPDWDHGNPVPGDIPSALNDLGIPIIAQVGDDLKIKCPAHLKRKGKEDRNPSCYVHETEGMFLCFSCGFSGPFIALVREVQGKSDERAAEWIREQGIIGRAKRILAGHTDFRERKEPEEEIGEAHLALFTDPPFAALESRGITLEASRHYGILWDPGRHMWITPVRDRNGTLLGWQEKSERYFKNYPRGMEKGQTLFGLEQLTGSTAVLVESPLDTAVIKTAEVDGAVSSFGVYVTDEQMELLLSRVEVLVLALDNDRDGKRERAKLYRRYRGRGTRILYWDYGPTEAKDPGDQSDEEIRRSYRSVYHPLGLRIRRAA